MLPSYFRLFNVNLKAVINVSQTVTKQMIASKTQGSIVHVSSQVCHLIFHRSHADLNFYMISIQASQVPLKDHAVYCSTKAALDMLCKVMALELGQHKVKSSNLFLKDDI